MRINDVGNSDSSNSWLRKLTRYRIKGILRYKSKENIIYSGLLTRTWLATRTSRKNFWSTSERKTLQTFTVFQKYFTELKYEANIRWIWNYPTNSETISFHRKTRSNLFGIMENLTNSGACTWISLISQFSYSAKHSPQIYY